MAALDTLSLITLFVQAICLAAVLWLCLPSFLTALRGGVQNGVAGGPSDVMPDGPDGIPASLHQELLDLGFEPLGVYWEKGLGQTFHEYVFVDPQRECCAAAYRMFQAEFPRVTLVTVATDGAVVMTQN